MSKPRKDGFGGKWTEEKLGALSAYLGAYTTALKNTPFNLTYIDAFAGAGTEEIKAIQESDLFGGEVPEDTIRYRHGSPLIALKNKPDSTTLYSSISMSIRSQNSGTRLKQKAW